MSLRYSFRHLFFGGKLRQKRLYKILEDLDEANGGETTDITALKTTVGDSSSGLVKEVNDLKSASESYTPVEVVVTYADESTETINLLSVVEEETQGE